MRQFLFLRRKGQEGIKEKILNACGELFDRIAIARGYIAKDNILLSEEDKKLGYSSLLLNEIEEMESLIHSIVYIARK